MKKIFCLSLVVGAFFLISCSSVKKQAVSLYLDRLKDKKAENVRFEPLPLTYKRKDHAVLDALWWNEDLKTSISYFSSCSKALKNLENFQTSAYPSGYKRIRVSKKPNSLYSVLEVSQSQSSAKAVMAVYTTRIRDCYFNINLVAGSLSSFEKEEALFKKIIKNFNYR